MVWQIEKCSQFEMVVHVKTESFLLQVIVVDETQVVLLEA